MIQNTIQSNKMKKACDNQILKEEKVKPLPVTVCKEKEIQKKLDSEVKRCQGFAA